MPEFPGSYVPINAHSNARVNAIVDNLLNPTLLNFRQVTVYDERATQVSSLSWKLTYPNWNEAFDEIVRLNGQEVSPASVDYVLGSVTMSVAANDGDVVNVTYNIDWFPVGILAGFIYRAIDTINNSGTTAPTGYTIADAPDSWDGVIADIVVSMCMEKLLLDYDLWYGRLIFAIGANELYEGGGDVVGQIETIKANAEERANRTMDNEKFKIGNRLSVPTQIYYNAVRGMGAGSRGAHGIPSTGRLRGWKANKYL